MLDRGLKVRSMVLPDVFLDHDKPNAMYAKAGLDAKGIVAIRMMRRCRPMADSVAHC
jgi:deoxyxylulose-5-phosphate synthase